MFEKWQTIQRKRFDMLRLPPQTPAVTTQKKRKRNAEAEAAVSNSDIASMCAALLDRSLSVFDTTCPRLD